MSEWRGKCMSCQKDMVEEEPPPRKAAGRVCDECQKPDWSGKCSVCEATPIHPVTGMCGPCTFGEAETANGNW